MRLIEYTEETTNAFLFSFLHGLDPFFGPVNPAEKNGVVDTRATRSRVLSIYLLCQGHLIDREIILLASIVLENSSYETKSSTV